MDVLLAYRKSYTGIPSDLTFDLFFKVNLEIQGQYWIKCAISALLWVLCVWYALPTYSKVDMGNSLVPSNAIYDLSFKVNLKDQRSMMHKMCDISFIMGPMCLVWINDEVECRYPGYLFHMELCYFLHLL